MGTLGEALDQFNETHNVTGKLKRHKIFWAVSSLLTALTFTIGFSKITSASDNIEALPNHPDKTQIAYDNSMISEERIGENLLDVAGPVELVALAGIAAYGIYRRPRPIESQAAPTDAVA